QQIGVAGDGMVQCGRQSLVIPHRSTVFFPRFKRVVARKKQDARLASYGAYCKVVLWPFRTRECLNESAFAFFMHTAAFAGFQECALNQQYLWRWGCLRIV